MKTRVYGLNAGLFVMAGLFHSAVAHAATCTPATIIGTYGFAAQGSNVLPSGNARSGAATLIALVGTYRFNADGTVTRAFTVNVNGEVGDAEDSGTFTVNANCTGTVVMNTIFGTEPIKLSIVGGGDAIMFMNAVPAIYLTGRMERQ